MGQEQRCCRRHDEHGDDDDTPHCLKRCDGGDSNYGHEKIVEKTGGKSECVRQAGIEGADSELFEKCEDEKKIQEENTSDEKNRSRDIPSEDMACIERSLFHGTVKNTAG